MMTTFSTSSCVVVAESLPLARRDGKEKRLDVYCCCCCGRWKEKEEEEVEEAAATAGDDEEWRVLRED